MKTVLQIIPYDSIGGVEVAARSVPKYWGNTKFVKAYLVSKQSKRKEIEDWHGAPVSENSLLAQLRLLKFALKLSPDLIIASLWRSIPVFILLQILRPRKKFVIFIHSESHSHLVDWAFTFIAMWRSNEIWADSASSLERRVPKYFQSKGRILSFLTTRAVSRSSLQQDRLLEPEPRFVFWGRLQHRKNLPRAIRLFSFVHRVNKKAIFTIYGPDHGEAEKIAGIIDEMGLRGAVILAGPRDHSSLFREIRGANFYLQTSCEEGMGMSVVEAMSIGLVPIVTPVGEISRYCRSGINAILVEDDAAAAAEILVLLSDAKRFRAMVEAALLTWKDHRLYYEDFIIACDRLLNDLD